MSVEIQLSENATEAERLGILTPLLAHNLANGGDDAHETFALLLRDPDSNEIIGGLYGRSHINGCSLILSAFPSRCVAEVLENG